MRQHFVAILEDPDFAFIRLGLDAAAFIDYVCDIPITFRIDFESLSKVLERVEDDDMCTLKVFDHDILSVIYEAKCTSTIQRKL
jgi:hypothetical protein